MKITISNKTCTHKPTKEESGKFFGKDFNFTTVECDYRDIRTIIENGYVITFLYNDNHFVRANNYMSKNYKGTQFICVDVDESDLTADQLIERMKYKPTFYHTTFSHKTEKKNYKNCYHFYYVLDKVIENEGNFNTLFNLFTTGIEDIYDKAAKDCHRCIYTTNKNNEYYEFKEVGSIYNPDELLSTNTTTTISFSEFVSNSTTNWEKTEISNISTTHTDIFKSSEISQPTTERCILTSNDFNLDPEFFNDLNSMSRGEFVMEYCDVFPYRTHTEIDYSLFKDGYADVRGIDYYEVPTAQYRWDKEQGRAVIKKIENGHRDSMLWLDGIAFMHIIPNITKEYLVYLMVREVYEHFLNGDKEFNNYKIVQKAKQVWTNINNLSITPIKKNFVLDRGYWIKHGISPKDAVSLVRKQIKDTDLGSLYDCNLTLEENIEEFKEYGVKCTKKRLIQWCEENNIEYLTNKEYRNSLIVYYYKEDNKRSSREIERLLKENNNIEVSYKTIQTVLTNFKIGKK